MGVPQILLGDTQQEKGDSHDDYGEAQYGRYLFKHCIDAIQSRCLHSLFNSWGGPALSPLNNMYQTSQRVRRPRLIHTNGFTTESDRTLFGRHVRNGPPIPTEGLAVERALFPQHNRSVSRSQEVKWAR